METGDVCLKILGFWSKIKGSNNMLKGSNIYSIASISHTRV